MFRRVNGVKILSAGRAELTIIIDSFTEQFNFSVLVVIAGKTSL